MDSDTGSDNSCMGDSPSRRRSSQSRRGKSPKKKLRRKKSKWGEAHNTLKGYMEIFTVCFECVNVESPLTLSGISGLGQCSLEVKELLKGKISQVKQG